MTLIVRELIYLCFGFMRTAQGETGQNCFEPSECSLRDSSAKAEQGERNRACSELPSRSLSSQLAGKDSKKKGKPHKIKRKPYEMGDFTAAPRVFPYFLTEKRL